MNSYGPQAVAVSASLLTRVHPPRYAFPCDSALISSPGRKGTQESIHGCSTAGIVPAVPLLPCLRPAPDSKKLKGPKLYVTLRCIADATEVSA